jgi:hypothetical protein
LIAGGSFAVPGGANLAVLEAGTWTALAGGVSGVDATVRAIAVAGDDIVVGGAFDSPVVNLGRLHQGTWSGPAGTWAAATVRPMVTDLVVKNDGVYIVGTFERIGDVAASRVARWSSLIEPLVAAGDTPLGVNGGVRALVVDIDGTLIAGGPFVAAGTQVAAHVARFADGRWEAIGAITDPVTALARGDSVYAGTSTGQVLRWSGTDWTLVGAMASGVTAMHVFEGQVIVAAGERVSRWNGADLSPLGSPLPWRIGTLGTVRDRLCAGVFVGDALMNPSPRPLWCWTGSSWGAELIFGAEVAGVATLDDGSAVLAGGLKLGGYVGLAIDRGNGWTRVDLHQHVSTLVPSGDGVFLLGHGTARFWDGKSAEPLPHLATGWFDAAVLTPSSLVVGAEGCVTSVDAASPCALGAAVFDF